MSEWDVFIKYNCDAICTATLQHLVLSLGAVLLGILVAVPLGIYISKHNNLSGPVLGVVSTIQTVPTLAFLGFLLPVLGIGFKPAIVVLFLYSLLPILRNTYTGIQNIDNAYIQAGQGMGMSDRQILFMVILPQALPVIMSGIRIATVYLISWATLAALIGAGGLGDLIITGMSTYEIKFIIVGTVPAAVFALLAGWILGKIENAVTPAGLKAKTS